MIGIYIRVSTEEQAKKGYSVRNQIAECRAKAETDEVIEYIDEGHTGEYLERPALMKLRRDVKEGIITKLICLDPDRLSRKLMNALIIDDEFRKRGVDMVYLSGEFAKTPEGQLFYSMRGAISEFEKAKITERMSSGRRRKAKEGKVVKNPFMYGYDYDKEKQTLVINKKEAEVVQLIFDLFTKPNDIVKGINGIAKYLTNSGYPTKKGKKVWHRQVVRQILFQSAYNGVYYQNKWNTEGMLGNKYKTNEEEKVRMTLRDKEEWIPTAVEPIIMEVQWEYAQVLLEQVRRRWAKTGIRPYLLSGLMRCGHCGNTFTGRLQTNWGKKEREYSDFKNTAGFKHQGCNMRLKDDKIEARVWEEIKVILDEPSLYKNEPINEMNFEIKRVEQLENEINKAKNGRKKLMQLFALDEMDDDEIRESLIELKQHKGFMM